MRRVLVIEDDRNIAEMQRDYLQLNGFQVDIAADGTTGLRQGLGGDYSVILVDLMLPGLDGFEVIRQLRQQLEIPVLIVSARSEDIDKIRGLGFGADDFVTKPFSPAELLARVQSHLKRYERLTGRNEHREIILHRSLEINTAAHKVTVNGKEITLTTKEYELLAFLATHPNIVFSKDRLFTAIWGEDAYGDTATVAVHVQKVRKKIERDPANPEYIETLWGTGYRFNA